MISINTNANVFSNYPDAMSLKDVARLLDISTKLASHLVRSGDIFGVKVGREYRVAKSSVIRYIKGNTFTCPKKKKRSCV